MKKLKLATSLGAIGLAAALVGGATMAWFTDEAAIAEATFTAGTVQIKADQSLLGSDGNLYSREVPYQVIAFEQKGINSTNPRYVAPGNFSTVYNRIKAATNGKPQEPEDFFTLGKKGSVTIQLSTPITENNVGVIECSWGSANPVENANVYVSDNGVNWEKIGRVSSGENPSGDQHESRIIIPENIGEIKFIKLEDDNSPSPDGYDIDYLGVVIMDEGNWNPGDVNELAFYVNNVGTKDVKVRAILTGAWENSDLPSDNVTISLVGNGNGWKLDEDESGNGKYVFYYKDKLNGSYNGKTPGVAKKLFLDVALDGAGTGNDYQGERYVLKPVFQAIQNSHSGEGSNGEADGWKWDDVDFVTGGKQ